MLLPSVLLSTKFKLLKVAIPSLPVVNVTGAVALVFAFPEVSPVTKAALLEVRFVTVPPEAELLK